MERYTFEASARWALHERGTVRAKNVETVFDFTVPPEFGGESGLWTPEHLLLASVASCYVATFRGISKKSNLEFHAITISAEGVIEKRDGSLCFTEITLRPEVAILLEEDRERAGRILEKAERGCLIARSLSSKFLLQPKVTVEAAVTG